MATHIQSPPPISSLFISAPRASHKYIQRILGSLDIHTQTFSYKLLAPNSGRLAPSLSLTQHPNPSRLLINRLTMSTPTSVDKLGHRAQHPPDQADTNPGSPYNKALPDEAHNNQVFNNDSVPASGPDASESPAGPIFSPSISHTSDTSSTSSPLSSSFENNPREDSSSSSNYDSESSTEGAEARSKKIADYVTVGEQIARRKDENEDAPKGTSLMDFENKTLDYSVSAE